MAALDLCLNSMAKAPEERACLADFSNGRAAEVLSFHQSIPGYAPTPLVSLPNLAKRLGLSAILVKDESKRFSLNAFKVLGGSYAIGRVLAERLGAPLEEIGWKGLSSPKALSETGRLTFVTATDGNHGRGVAWTAKTLGHHALVLMPKGSAEERVLNILATGAECEVTELGYDETVSLAAEKSRSMGGVLVQDSGWPGYERIPSFITQGYMTLLEEIMAATSEPPTHVFLQCGVGSFPAAALGRLAAAYGQRAPKGVLVEPKSADCLYRSVASGDGSPKSSPGPLDTIMAGLACGVPSALSWPVIRDLAFAAIRCDDFLAANGMRILASPLPGDPPVESGESGAVGAGLLEYLLSKPRAREWAEALGLDGDSRALLISTEGATSAEDYRDAVWRGRCPEIA